MRHIGPVGGLLLLGLTTVAWAGAPLEEEWREISIGGTKAYVIPPQVVRSLGLQHEEIPPEDNAATYYLRAIEAVPPLARGLDPAYDAALSQPWERQRWPEFYAWFERTAEARQLLREAARRERCQFPLLTQRPGETLLMAFLLPHLAHMRSLARLLIIEGHLREAEDKPQEALQCYLLTYPLGRHAASDPMLIAGLVGLAVQKMGNQAIRSCLSRHELSEDTLARLNLALVEAEKCLPDRRRWIVGERAMGMQVAEPVILPQMGRITQMTGGAAADVDLSFADAFVTSRAFRILWPDRTIRSDLEGFYRNLDALAQKTTWELASALRQEEGKGLIANSIRDWNLIARMVLPSVHRAHLQYIHGATLHAALRQIVALQRYRLRHRRFPDELTQLVPDFLPQLPPDPYSGEAFKYRHENDGWLLYSVGQDLRDDGGVHEERGGGGGDIIFRSAPREAKP